MSAGPPWKTGWTILQAPGSQCAVRTEERPSEVERVRKPKERRFTNRRLNHRRLQIAAPWFRINALCRSADIAARCPYHVSWAALEDRARGIGEGEDLDEPFLRRNVR